MSPDQVLSIDLALDIVQVLNRDQVLSIHQALSIDQPLSIDQVLSIDQAFNIVQALKEIARILKPGGRLFCLEFMPPEGFLKAAYDFYSFNLIPWFGEHIAKDREAYQYLVESIRQFPEPDILKSMCLEQGFSKCAYEKWTGNIVALHQAVVN